MVWEWEILHFHDAAYFFIRLCLVHDDLVISLIEQVRNRFFHLVLEMMTNVSRMILLPGMFYFSDFQMFFSARCPTFYVASMNLDFCTNNGLLRAFYQLL